jgi:hypothetical protein
VLCAGSTLLLAPSQPCTRTSLLALFTGTEEEEAPTSTTRQQNINKSSGTIAKSASNNLQELFLSPTGRLNFGFITEGKLTDVLFTPSSWGSQLVRQHRRINKFFGAVAREKEDFC